MNLKNISLLWLIWLAFIGLYSATGCDLNDPDRDVKRLFPESTSYKTTYVNIKNKGGEKLLKEIESDLADKFSGTYETIDVPYTMYSIYKNKDLIGYIHGVNQKGRYGGIQVFLAVDNNAKIRNFYIQKITSPTAKLWRDQKFSKNFQGLNLKDFSAYKPGSNLNSYKNINNPDPKSNEEFNHILRAVKKNLILIDVFLIKKA